MLKETILEWVNLQSDLKKIRAKEMVLRKEIVTYVTQEGLNPTATMELFGYKFKATTKLTYTLDKVAYENRASMGDLSEDELLCVKLVPTLLRKNYDDLADDCVLKSELVTVKAAAPTLGIESILEV